MSARKRPDAALPAPSNPAPTIPVFHKKLRRFMGTSAARRANPPARGIIPPEPAGWYGSAQVSPIPKVSPNLLAAHRNLSVRQRSPALLLDARKRPTGRFNEDWIL